jgi:hypothetical protein
VVVEVLIVIAIVQFSPLGNFLDHVANCPFFGFANYALDVLFASASEILIRVIAINFQIFVAYLT